MMESACRVFSERGFSATTMEAVAVDAGVAVQTLYFTFHSKGDLLQAAYEYAVLGPDPTPPHLSPWWLAAEREPNVNKAVSSLVDGSVEVFERAAPLVWVVRADEEARDAYDFNESLRVQGYAVMIDFLSRKHPLRPRLTKKKARDLLLTLLGPHVFFLLTTELGWTARDYRTWVKTAILREIFAIDPGIKLK